MARARPGDNALWIAARRWHGLHHVQSDALAGRGVAFVRFPGMEQDDRGVWAAQGGARVAWFRDPDGNTLSLDQQ